MQMVCNWPNNLNRRIIALVLMFTFARCGHTMAVNSTDYKDAISYVECKVIKIQRFENYYFIYAKGITDGRGYKIVSAMDIKPYTKGKYKNHKKNKIIKVDAILHLRLTWVSEPNEEDKQGSYMEFERCVTRFPMVKICTETGYELYESKDIKGLEVID